MAVYDDRTLNAKGSSGGSGQALEHALARALDLLARKEQELAEARRSEESYRSLVEKVMDLVICVDKNGRFTFVNSASLGVLGYRPEELIGQHFSMVFTEESRVEAAVHFRRNLQGHGPRSVYELEMLSKDERRVPVEIHATNVYENGEVAGIRGIARDISDRRREESEQERRFNQLRVINRVGQQIVSVLSLDELLPSLVDLVSDSFGYHWVSVFLRDQQHRNMVLEAYSGSYGSPIAPGTAIQDRRAGDSGMGGADRRAGAGQRRFRRSPLLRHGGAGPNQVRAGGSRSPG